VNIQGQLDSASRLLQQSDSVDAWSRAAAFLARQALEACVREAIERRFGKLLQPSFSSQLIVLRAVVDEEIAREIAWTWSALSSATHAHGYELPPTAGELERWLETVARLANELSGVKP